MDTDGNTNNVINAFKEYGNKYDEMWKDYLAEEYEIVKNRQIGSKGNYVSYTIPVKVTTPDNLKALYQKIGALDCVKHVI